MRWGSGIGRALITISSCILLEGCLHLPPEVESLHSPLAAGGLPATKSYLLSSTFEHQHPKPPYDQGQLGANEGAPSEPKDLWERIRKGLFLPQGNEKRIAAQLRALALRQASLDQIAERARPYLHHIVEEIERRAMPMEIALLPIIESAYQPEAFSPLQAAGIWQLIPSTGRRFGLKQNEWYDGRRDVLASTTAALDYLETLHKRFDGDWLHAIAAYNCGEKVVEQAIGRNRAAGRSTSFWSLDLPQETEHFVPKLLTVSSIVADPARYQVGLKPIPNKPYITEVEIGGQIGLAQAAKLADLHVDELRSLNTGYVRAVTDPQGPNKLALPLTKATTFERRLAQLPPEQGGPRRHRVSVGESLESIACRYSLSVNVLQQANKLTGTAVRIGQRLVIPTTKRMALAVSDQSAGSATTQ